MFDTIINFWLGLTLLVTFYYALFSFFATSRALRSFSGTAGTKSTFHVEERGPDLRYDTSTKQITKRLGIVYAFWVFDNASRFYIIMTDETWKRDLQSMMLLSNALYSSALCYLVTQNDFWARDAFKKNIPFVFLNSLLLIIHLMI